MLGYIIKPLINGLDVRHLVYLFYGDNMTHRIDQIRWVCLKGSQDLGLKSRENRLVRNVFLINDISFLYLYFDWTSYQNLDLNIWFNVYFIAYLLDLVLLSLWLIFCRELVEISKKLELEPPCTTTRTVRAQDRTLSHRPCAFAPTVQNKSGSCRKERKESWLRLESDFWERNKGEEAIKGGGTRRAAATRGRDKNPNFSTKF